MIPVVDNFLGLFKEFFAWRKLVNDGGSQSALNAVKNAKRLREAANISEQIFQFTDPSIGMLVDKKAIKKYWKLRKEFDKKD